MDIVTLRWDPRLPQGSGGVLDQIPHGRTLGSLHGCNPNCAASSIASGAASTQGLPASTDRHLPGEGLRERRGPQLGAGGGDWWTCSKPSDRVLPLHAEDHGLRVATGPWRYTGRPGRCELPGRGGGRWLVGVHQG